MTQQLFREQTGVYYVYDLERLKKEMETKLKEITSETLNISFDFFEDGHPDLCVFIDYGNHDEEEVKTKIDDALENPDEISLLANALLGKLLGQEVSRARVYFNDERQQYIKVEVA